MKTKKISQFSVLALFCYFLLIPTISEAAPKINFSGDWTYNESNSNVGEGRGGRAASKMLVKQDGNNLMIERTRAGRDGQTRTDTEELTLDGKVVKNEGENRTSNTSAAWSGNSLVIKSDMVMSRQGQSFEMKSTETWQLSEDGKTLTIQSNSSSSRGERTATLIYNKK